MAFQLLFSTAAAVTAAGTFGRAAAAATAATTAATLSLFFIADHAPDDQGDDNDQNCDDNDIARGHSGHSFLFLCRYTDFYLGVRILILSENQVQQNCQRCSCCNGKDAEYCFTGHE